MRGIGVSRVDYNELSSDRFGETAATAMQTDARKQVARHGQTERLAGMNIVCNTDMNVAEVRKSQVQNAKSTKPATA